MTTTKLFTPNDLIEFENNQRYSSIGKMLESMKSTAPAFGFGTSNRYQAQMIYRDKKLLQKGKCSPGPCYNAGNYIAELLAKQPTVKIGKAQRKFLNQKSYDYYNRQDQNYEPHQANDFRRLNASQTRFGLAQRFQTEYSFNRTPGPDQYESLPVKEQAPAYTMCAKRPISKSFQGSTPELVGPGLYEVMQSANMVLGSQPRIGFTKSEKMKPSKSCDRNQTYYTKGSMGVQIKSNSKTKPAYSIGKQSRDVKPGIFKRDLEGCTTKLRISMPKF